MGHETVTRQATVRGKNGLHMRPAEVFARQASQFESRIEVIREDVRVDGKSILDVMLLAAVPGTVLTLEATGPDATAALEALVKLIEVDLAIEPTSDRETTT
jgi:phosphotransferase system HPr (HPr) family protein